MAFLVIRRATMVVAEIAPRVATTLKVVEDEAVATRQEMKTAFKFSPPCEVTKQMSFCL